MAGRLCVSNNSDPPIPINEMCNACDPRNRPDTMTIVPLIRPIDEVGAEDKSGLSVVMWSWFLTALLVGVTSALVLVTG